MFVVLSVKFFSSAACLRFKPGMDWHLWYVMVGAVALISLEVVGLRTIQMLFYRIHNDPGSL